MKKVYISGPMTGCEDYNRPKFKEIANLWRWEGFDIISPPEYDDEAEGNRWTDYLRKDLKLIVQCDSVAAIKGWENSKGARLEIMTAFQLGMPIYFAETFKMMMHRTDRTQVKT